MDHSRTRAAGPREAVTVVLVEDHALLAELLTALLSDAGIQVVATAATQRDGHLAVTTHRPHLAVIDNELPDGSGIELCRSLRVEAPEVTLLLHTGATSARETAEARDAGAAEVVLKSLRGESLLAAIQAHGPRLG